MAVILPHPDGFSLQLDGHLDFNLPFHGDTKQIGVKEIVPDGIDLEVADHHQALGILLALHL